MKWREAILSTVLQDYQSGTWGSPPKQDGRDLPVLRSTNINDASLVLNGVAYRSVPPRSAKRYKLIDGDIIVTTSSGSRHLIGKCALFQQPEDEHCYLYSNFTLRLRPRQDVIVPRYLHLYLNSSKAKAQLLRIQSTTSGLRNLPIPLYLAQTLPLAPLSEQHRIVEILDQADALRKKRAEADAKAACILPTLFYRMFGDPLANPRGFLTEMVGNLLTVLRNGTTAEQNQAGHGYPVTRIETISAGTINPERVAHVEMDDFELAKWRMEPGDILFSHINSESHIGKTAIYRGHPDPLIHGMNLLLLRPDAKRTRHEYLFAMLNTDSVRTAYRQKCKRAVNQASLNQKDISTLRVAVPPLDAQDRFCRLAENLLMQIEAQRKAADKIERLFENLLHSAFAGDLTTRWRESHMKELLLEMEQQAKTIGIKEP